MGEVTSELLPPEVGVNEARALAAERTRMNQERQKRRYDLKRRMVNIRVGDLIMLEISTLHIGRSERFNARRSGPFEVTRVFDNNTVEIIGGNGRLARVNAERCVTLSERPSELRYNDGVDDTIESQVRGPGLHSGGEWRSGYSGGWSKRNRDTMTNWSWHQKRIAETEDLQISGLTPIRRSDRQKRQTSATDRIDAD